MSLPFRLHSPHFTASLAPVKPQRDLENASEMKPRDWSIDKSVRSYRSFTVTWTDTTELLLGCLPIVGSVRGPR